MKRFFVLSLCYVSIAFAQAPVYLNIGSHNETNDSTSPGHAYISQIADYQSIKSFVIELSDSVLANGAAWNMMIDANMIRACITHDTAISSSNDLIEWADGLSYMEVDPHNHFNMASNPYNYADLNYLLTQCGITVRHNLGGFLWKDLDGTPPCNGVVISEDWTQFRDSVSGYHFPTTKWKPRMLWGGGTPNHCSDNLVLGMWAPTDSTVAGFNTHDPGSDLPNNGSSCGKDYAIFDTTNVTNVINKVTDIINYAQTYGNSNSFYTLTIMFNFRNSASPGFVDKISEFMRAMKPYVNNGSVVWMTLSEKYDYWYTNHTASESFIQPCYNMGIGIEPNNISAMVRVFPNPADDFILVTLPDGLSGGNYQWLDMEGRVVETNTFNSPNINTAHLKDGLYILKLDMDGNIALKKVMINH